MSSRQVAKMLLAVESRWVWNRLACIVRVFRALRGT